MDLGGVLRVGARCEHLDQCRPVRLGQRRQVDAHHRPLRQLTGRVGQLRERARRPCRQDEGATVATGPSGPNQVVGESQRTIVEPLDVVEEQERRPELAQSQVDRFEDLQRLHRRRSVVARPSQEMIERGAALGADRPNQL
jgi:hypothetical protein